MESGVLKLGSLSSLTEVICVVDIGSSPRLKLDNLDVISDTPVSIKSFEMSIACSYVPLCFFL